MSKSMKRRRLEEEFALDEDVLYYIFNQFGLRDCIRMGAVCKSWLSVSKWSITTRPRPQLPWLMMLSNPNSKSMRNRRIHSLPSWRMKLFNPSSKPVETEKDNSNSKSAEKEENEVRCFFCVYDNTIYDNFKLSEISGKRCCGSFNNADARGWLMIIDDENLEMRLFHPWRRIQLQLPHHSTLQRKTLFNDRSRYPLLVDLIMRKSAMSDDASMVVVIHDLWSLGLWTKGNKVWTRVRCDFRSVCDVIYQNGQFYVACDKGSIGVIRLNEPQPYVEILTEDIEIEGYQRRIYLVADSISKSFFILVRKSLLLQEALEDPNNIRRTLGFKVYQLGLEETGEYKKNPVKVKSLGDRIIFLGQNSSIIFMANQFPGFKGNRIYFTDDYMESHLFESPIGCVDFGIFNMEDKTIKPLLSNRFHPTFSPPVWIMPPF